MSPMAVLPRKQHASVVAKLVIGPTHMAAQVGVLSVGYATDMGTLTRCVERYNPNISNIPSPRIRSRRQKNASLST